MVGVLYFLAQQVRSFKMFLRGHVFICNQYNNAGSNRNRTCIFSLSWESQGLHKGLLTLCPEYPSDISLQNDTYIDHLVELFSKLYLELLLQVSF